MIKRLVCACLLFSMLLVAGCAIPYSYAGNNPKQQTPLSQSGLKRDHIDAWVKGTWVRPTTNKQDAIDAEVARLKALGVTDLYLETYFLGRTAYPSQVMARYGLRNQHPQFRGDDVVQQWIDTAHQQGLRLHIWFQTYYAGNQAEFWDNQPYGPILTEHPEWANRSYTHMKQALNHPAPSVVESGHYFLDPANREVQTYIKALITEIVERYPTMDGFQLDYIRYPSTVKLEQPNYLLYTWGYTDSAWADWSQQPAVAEALKKLPVDTSKGNWQWLTNTHPLWNNWTEYKKAQVSDLVKWTSNLLDQKAPKAQLTTVMFFSHEPTKAQKCQDYPKWVANGWVDAIVPIGLSDQPAQLKQQLIQLKKETQHRPILVGNFDLYNRRPKAQLIENLTTTQQEAMKGVVFFEASRVKEPYLETVRQLKLAP